MTIYNIKHPRIRGFELVKDAPSDTQLPTRATSKSAGYDLYLTEDVHIEPYECSKVIPLNIKTYMPHDEFLMIVPRSSVGTKKNLILCNTVGIIDSDYYSNKDNDGNIMVKLFNYSGGSVDIKKGERICQAIFVRYGLTDDDNVTTERKGGVGSSGK